MDSVLVGWFPALEGLACPYCFGSDSKRCRGYCALACNFLLLLRLLPRFRFLNCCRDHCGFLKIAGYLDDSIDSWKLRKSWGLDKCLLKLQDFLTFTVLLVLILILVIGSLPIPIIPIIISVIVHSSIWATSIVLLAIHLRLWRCVWDVHTNTFDDMIFSTKRLSHFRIQESNERKSPEGPRNKNVCNLAELGKVLSQIIGGKIFGTSANENFAWNLLNASFLQNSIKD